MTAITGSTCLFDVKYVLRGEKCRITKFCNTRGVSKRKRVWLYHNVHLRNIHDPVEVDCFVRRLFIFISLSPLSMERVAGLMKEFPLLVDAIAIKKAVDQSGLLDHVVDDVRDENLRAECG